MEESIGWREGSKIVQVVLYLAVVGLDPGIVEAQVHREDFMVASDSGIELFVREVTVEDAADKTRPPVVLLHGARVPSVPSFDLPVRNGSLAADLARAGHAVYLMDARGYGGSTRPPEMSEAPDANAPLVRSPEVVRDVAVVVDWVRRRTNVERVALLGWATGGHWFGYYASLNPGRVSHLILYNTLYGGSSEHAQIGHGSGLEDPGHRGRFNLTDFGAYRLSTHASLFPSWDQSIPVGDKTSWRDPHVANAYAEFALQSDPTSFSRTPPSFRAPSGPLEDSYYLATGRQLWDASLIRSATLIIASERDFWSRPEDRELLQDHLVHAAEVDVVVIPDATHYVHLDQPERGRARFLATVLRFLAEEYDDPVGRANPGLPLAPPGHYNPIYRQ